MSEIGKAEVQKMYDAQNGVSKEKNDPFAALNPETGNFFFRNEYERKMFLVGLESSKVDAAISALQKIKDDKIPSGDSKNTLGLSPSEATDYLEVLGKLKDKLQENKQKFRAELHDNALIIDATIPGPKWEKSGKEVTIEGKKYGVEKREWSGKGKFDLKIDAGLTASVLVKDVSDKEIDTVLKTYEAANKKNAPDSLLKSGMFGKTVKYEEIAKLPANAPAQAAEISNQIIDLNKEGWTLNANGKLEKDGKLFSGKGKFIKEGKDGNTEEWKYQDGILTDGYVQWNNSKKRLEGKFANDSKVTYLNDGIFTTEEWEVRNGKWKKEGENYIFSGTITSADRKKTTKWENGKEVIAVKSIADVVNDAKAPKGYDLSYDESKKQVQLKKGNKVVGFFTPENDENKDRRTAPQIQEWAATKVQKIQDAIDAKNPDKFSSASDILKSVQTIPGLDRVTNLKEFGFMRDKDGVTPPEWLSWENIDDGANFNVKLKAEYEVKDGKIKKKP